MSDRSELIAQFQAITGNESLDECTNILENHDWDIERAVHTALAMQEDPDLRAPTSSSHASPSSSSSSNASPSSSPSSSSSSTSSGASSSGMQFPPRDAQRVYSVQRPPRDIPQLITFGPAPLRNVINFLWSFLFGLVSPLLSLFGLTRTRGSERRDPDPKAAAARFLLNFEQKYGTSHPDFYQDGYMPALREAQRSYRIFVIYLHCADHQDTENFCRQTLAAPEVSRFLAENEIIFWAGDIAEIGAHQVATSLGASSFPFLAMVGPQGSQMSIFQRIDGALSSADLLTKLNQGLQRFAPAIRQAKIEREVRERERLLRLQQEREYEESLKADQEKERKMKEEQEALQRKKEEEEQAEQERLKKEEEEKNARQKKAQQLPSEPEVGESGVTLIVFRLTEGSRVQRRFRESETVQVLYDFVETLPQNAQLQNFALCTTLPKVFFNEKQLTLKEVNLTPKALLVVEEIFSDE